jgi:hypothetical protein
MSHDGATAGNDAAVTRSDYGRRRPIHPRRQTILVEKASTAASLATSRFWVRPLRFGRAGTRAELLRLLMLPDFDRADRIGEFWSYPEPQLRRAPDQLRGGSDLGAVLVGMLREAGR